MVPHRTTGIMHALPSLASLLLLASIAWGGDADPTISANGLFLAGYTKLEDPDGAPTSRTGLFAQQLEVHLAAPVDSGIVGEVTLTLPRGSRTEERIDITEAFIAVRLSPLWDIRAGRFYVAFGQHNLLHSHEFPFLDRPLVLENLFGIDGIDEVGLDARRRLPRLGNAVLSLQTYSGDNLRWPSRTDEDLLHAVRLHKTWEASQDRAEAGASWAGGANLEERFTHAIGGDLTVERFDAAGILELRWQAEYALASEDFRAGRRTTGGLTTYVQHRIARRWWAQARYDIYGLPRPSGESWEDRGTILLAYIASDRAPLRIQYSRWRVDALGRGFNQYHVQLNFTLGDHRPHRYHRS
ncbi:hypothetical protein ACFL6X_03300 [Candidatus Latescibacterota bacterium]